MSHTQPASADMTGAEVEAIRQALERALGMRITLRRLGVALGLAPDRAGDQVRKWIATAPSGPAATALRLLAMAAGGAISATMQSAGLPFAAAPNPCYRAMMLAHARELLERADALAVEDGRAADAAE